MSTVWITVYKDTVVPEYSGSDNLLHIKVSEELARLYFSERVSGGYDTFDNFINNHTADDVEDFCWYAKEHGGIVDIDGMDDLKNWMSSLCDGGIENPLNLLSALQRLFPIPGTQELALSFSNVYLSIHSCDDGYDYNYYNEEYVLQDGGVYDDPSVSIWEALSRVILDDSRLFNTVCNAYFSCGEPCKLEKVFNVIDFGELEENLSRAEGEKGGKEKPFLLCSDAND